ncbi:hypothetical protein KBA27_01985 [bacterium]|nr:hypothetical protein [bacterium]
MLDNSENLKLVKKIDEKMNTKLKWLLSNQSEMKSSEFINEICSDTEIEASITSNSDKIEAMVKESLIKEFSPDIVKSKSYSLLVDAIIHNIKKKQLEAMDNEEIAE